MSERESFGKGDTFEPFSNGHEYRMWMDINCHRGEKGCRKYRPNATSSKDGCPIEVAIAIGSVTDDSVPCRIGLRADLLEPGSNGRLVRREPGLIPACPEYRGYDEPDDRPRRGSRPPEGQMDLLDPRAQPSPQHVNA